MLLKEILLYDLSNQIIIGTRENTFSIRLN